MDGRRPDVGAGRGDIRLGIPLWPRRAARTPFAHAAVRTKQKKARCRKTGSGLCSLPHVGCGAIVNEVLSRMHAALQNDTCKYKNQEKTDTCVWRRTTAPVTASAGTGRARGAAQVAQQFAGSVATR